MDDFEPLPPTREENELHDSMELVDASFVRASAYPEQFWHEISYAGATLNRVAARRDAPTLSKALCQRLVQNISWARIAPTGLSADDPDVPAVVRGFDAFIGLVLLLGEPPETQAARHKHVRFDMLAYARILQNIAHNRCLIDEIAERADRRRKDVVANILKRAAA